MKTIKSIKNLIKILAVIFGSSNTAFAAIMTVGSVVNNGNMVNFTGTDVNKFNDFIAIRYDSVSFDSITTNNSGNGWVVARDSGSISVDGSIGTASNRLYWLDLQGANNSLTTSNIYLTGNIAINTESNQGSNTMSVTGDVDIGGDLLNSKVDNSESASSGNNKVTIGGKLTARNVVNSSHGSSLGNHLTINQADLSGGFSNGSYSANSGVNKITINGKVEAGYFYNSDSSNGSVGGGILEFNINRENLAESAKIEVDGGDVKIAQGSEIILNLSSSSGSVSVYDIVSVTNGTLTYDENTKLSDNSALIDTRIDKIGERLQVTETIDSSTTSTYDETQEQIVDNVFRINASSGSEMDRLQQKLRSFSDDESEKLQNAISSLGAARNNMTSLAVNSVFGEAVNIISSHLNSGKFNDSTSGFASGNSAGNNVGNNSKLPPLSNIWGQFVAGQSSQDQRQGQDGYDSDMAGFIFGSDVILNNKSNLDNIVGVAFSYIKSDVDSNGNSDQSTEIDSYQITFYNNNIKKSNLGLYNQNMINIAYNKYDFSRTLADLLRANAKYDGVQYGIKSGFGYNAQLSDNLLLSPNISLQYSRVEQDSYQETGAGNAGQKVNKSHLNTLVSDLGLRLAYKTKVSHYEIIPEFNSSWSRNLKDNGQKVTSSFIAGGDVINNQSVSLIRDIFNFGVGFTISDIKNKNGSISAKYNRQEGSGYDSDSFLIKYRMEF